VVDGVDISSLNVNENLRIHFKFGVKSSRGVETFEHTFEYKPNISPEIIDVDYETGATQISGFVYADDAGKDLIGAEIIAVPSDGGNAVYGSFNTHDRTFLINDLAEDTSYDVSIQLEYKSGHRVKESNVYTFNTRTGIIDTDIYD
jgi:hypothetical protein